MRELIAILSVFLEMMNEEDDEIEVIVNELSPSLALFLAIQNHRLGPTSFVGITNYIQYTVERYTDELFKQHFRMSRTAFQVLRILINVHL